MEISQRDFFILLLHSGVCGIILGALYEIFRVGRAIATILMNPSAFPPVELFGKSILIYQVIEPQTNQRKSISKRNRLGRGIVWVFTLLSDIIYMLIWAIAVISVSYALNGGRIRWMVYVGLLSGFFAYRLTLGKTVKRVLLTALILINNLICKINRLCFNMARRIIKKVKSIPINKRKRKNEKQGGKTCCE